jgi:hypothetical protein
LATLAFVSGNQDPNAIRGWSLATGVVTVVDVERFIREDGPWLDGWLATSGSGLYGNGSVHFEPGQPVGRGAACNIFAGYYGYDPQATWPGWLPRPHLCGWQEQGTHTEFGIAVDASWMDDQIGGTMFTAYENLRAEVGAWRDFVGWGGDPAVVPTAWANTDGKVYNLQLYINQPHPPAPGTDLSTIVAALTDLKTHPAVVTDPVLVDKLTAIENNLNAPKPPA